MSRFLLIAILLKVALSFAQPTPSASPESRAAAAAFIDEDPSAVGACNDRLCEAIIRGDIEAIAGLLDKECARPQSCTATYHMQEGQPCHKTMLMPLGDGDRSLPIVHNPKIALHIAAQHGQIAALRVLLKHDRFLMPAAFGVTALQVAAHFGQIEALRMLLEDGHFLSPTSEGATALHFAAAGAQVEAMRILLLHGGFLATMSNGVTALQLAARTGDRRAVLVFIFHIRSLELVGAETRRTIASDPSISKEIKELIEGWERPEWPAERDLRPSHLLSIIEGLDDLPFGEDVRNELARHIVSNFYREHRDGPLLSCLNMACLAPVFKAIDDMQEGLPVEDIRNSLKRLVIGNCYLDPSGWAPDGINLSAAIVRNMAQFSAALSAMMAARVHADASH